MDVDANAVYCTPSRFQCTVHDAVSSDSYSNSNPASNQQAPPTGSIPHLLQYIPPLLQLVTQLFVHVAATGHAMGSRSRVQMFTITVRVILPYASTPEA
ncbi:hypothetical protein AB1N83_013379 [Pleurotus pulmonarius]